MSVGFESADFTKRCAALRDELEGLAGEERWLRARLATDVADGFPTNSGYEPRGGAANVVHDFGDGPVTVPQHSDPVGELVGGREERPDVLSAALTQGWAEVRAAELALGRSWNELRAVTVSIERARAAFAGARPPVKPEAEKPKDELWCVSCARARVFSPRSRGVLCAWCDGWRRSVEQAAEGDPMFGRPSLPYVELLDVRSQGRRVTDALVQEVERARRAKVIERRRKSKRKGRR